MTIINDVYNVFFGIKRNIGGIIPDVVVEERHSDSITITDSPVETGAPISDHAYINPKEVTIKIGWSPSSNLINSVLNLSFFKGISSLNELYAKMIELMEARQTISVSTGKRIYENMLIQSIEETTNEETENALILVVKLREVIIVSTEETEIKDENQENPEETAPPSEGGERQAEKQNTSFLGRGLGGETGGRVLL